MLWLLSRRLRCLFLASTLLHVHRPCWSAGYYHIEVLALAGRLGAVACGPLWWGHRGCCRIGLGRRPGAGHVQGSDGGRYIIPRTSHTYLADLPRLVGMHLNWTSLWRVSRGLGLRLDSSTWMGSALTISAGCAHYVGPGELRYRSVLSVWADTARATWSDGAGVRRGSWLDPTGQRALRRSCGIPLVTGELWPWRADQQRRRGCGSYWQRFLRRSLFPWSSFLGVRPVRYAATAGVLLLGLVLRALGVPGWKVMLQYAVGMPVGQRQCGSHSPCQAW